MVPRAQMKVAPLHGPCSSSFDVAPPDVCLTLRSAPGAAAVSVANKSAVNPFILKD
jgi:hypothetical protein